MTAGEFPVRGEHVAADALDASRWLDDHGDALYRYARSHVGRRELAEDLVQDTFLAAVKGRPFRSESTVRTWLIAILRRKIVDYYRGQATALDGDCAAGSSGGDAARMFAGNGRWQAMPAKWKTPAEALEDREFWAVLNACLSKLPATLASAFVLRELEDLPVDELSETLEVSAGNVRVRLYRARLYLRECLQRNWFGKDFHRRTRTS